MEEKILEIIKEESENANVRKYTCINGFGYSQFERNIAERVVKLFCQPAIIKEKEQGDGSGSVCEHPQRRREYYRDKCYKCWECLKIVVEQTDL